MEIASKKVILNAVALSDYYIAAELHKWVQISAFGRENYIVHDLLATCHGISRACWESNDLFNLSVVHHKLTFLSAFIISFPYTQGTTGSASQSMPSDPLFQNFPLRMAFRKIVRRCWFGRRCRALPIRRTESTASAASYWKHHFWINYSNP